MRKPISRRRSAFSSSSASPASPGRSSWLGTMRRLPPEAYQDLVRRALAEDVGAGDVTTDATVPPTQRARGVFLVKTACVLAGVDVAVEAFRQLEPGITVSFSKTDGDA